MAGLPITDCLVVAVTTPVGVDYRPNGDLLLERCRSLLETGCDGIALFGTTGEGTEFAVEDRQATLEAIIAGGLDPARILVSVGALSVQDIVRLSCHALDQNVGGLLLMPPCVYRSGITDDGTFRFYATVIDQVGRPEARLYLYHFPDICGIPVTPAVIRRLEERYPGTIAGVKDSGGNLEFTEGLLRRFSHLSIFTGTEIHLPEVMAIGARGTICGLGNVMPRLIRGLFDARTLVERQDFVPLIGIGDSILSRHPFIASVKALVAHATGNSAWRVIVPPMTELPLAEEQRMITDFRHWEAGLPASQRSLFPADREPDPKVVEFQRG